MHHIGLVVKDCHLSADFYVKALGLKKGESFSSENLDIVFLETGSSIIELLQFKDDRPSRSAGLFDHMAFEVNNVEEAMANLEAMGVSFNESPRISITGSKVVFFSGPDGERLELMEKHNGVKA